VRSLRLRERGLIGADAAILAGLTVWAFAPLVVLVLYVAAHGGVLIGTNGADFFDQFQYLAWIRDEGSHVLASNLWATGNTPHDYVQPMYLISGLLWRLGVSIQVAHLVWKPVAVLVLFAGCCAYVRRRLPRGRGPQAAALTLALFYECPLLALADWTGHLSSAHRLALVLATDDANSALNLWGFEHAAIAIGLMPVFLLATERVLARYDAEGRVDRRSSAVAAVAGSLVSWLHPWQAVILLAIVAGLVVLRPPRRRHLALAVPVIATTLPLLYGVALTRWDASWRIFEARLTATATAPWWALLASFGPLVALAGAGLRRPRDDAEWMLLLWVLATAGVYFLVPEFPPHALAGVTLPLSVLAVRGWERVRARLRVSRRVAAPVALAAVLVGTVPAAVYHAQGVHDEVSNTLVGALSLAQSRLTAEEAAALAYLSQAPRAGAVLAPPLLSLAVPAFTDREAYAGH
jgi:hypothetical protein